MLLVASNAHVSTPLFHPLWKKKEISKKKNLFFFFFFFFFFRNLDPHNGGFNRKRVAILRKDVGLWLEFAFFGI